MIRDVTDDDLEFCFDIAIKFCDLAQLDYKQSAVRDTVLKLMKNGILLRSDKGIIGGLVYPLYMNGDLVSQEFFWYSEGKDGIQLLKAFESRSKEMGAKRIIMISLHNDYQHKIDDIYKSQGYTEMEKSFSKGVI